MAEEKKIMPSLQVINNMSNFCESKKEITHFCGEQGTGTTGGPFMDYSGNIWQGCLSPQTFALSFDGFFWKASCNYYQ